MTWEPDSAVILSLPHRTDRRAHMQSMVTRLGFNPQLVDAVDGTQIDVPNWWQSSPQAYGNAQSHRAALQAATGSVMVLEDDAFIPGDFQARLQTVLVGAPDWDIIMLGGEHVQRPLKVGPGVLRSAGTMRSIGYIARGDAIPRMISAIDRAINHWDNAWLQVQRSVRTYAPDPFIIIPSGHSSDIPDSTPYKNSRRRGRN